MPLPAFARRFTRIVASPPNISVGSRGASNPLGRMRRVGRGRVRVPEAAVGVVLVGVGVLVSVLSNRSDPTQRVPVAVRTIARGESVEPGDLRWAQLSGDRLGGIVTTNLLASGVAAVDIAVGTPIVQSLLMQPTGVGPDEVALALALDPGDAPNDLAVGDRVGVVLVTEVEPGAAPDVEMLERASTVMHITEADPSVGSRRVIELGIASSLVTRVAAASDVRLTRLAAGTA